MLFTVIMTKAREIMSADRSTLFLLDESKQELWSRVADGNNEIRFPVHTGIAGHVAVSATPLNIPSAYEDARFNQDIDRKTGYHTRSILAVPIFNPSASTRNAEAMSQWAESVMGGSDAGRLMGRPQSTLTGVDEGHEYEEDEEEDSVGGAQEAVDPSDVIGVLQVR